MGKLKLSQLDNGVQIANEFHTINSEVGELKDDIIEHNTPYHNVKGDWFVITPAKWEPNAKDMLDGYIESIYQEMYEDWDDRAWNCITDEVINKIQKILDETFDEATTNYWEFDFSKPVEIDIRPFKLG